MKSRISFYFRIAILFIISPFFIIKLSPIDTKRTAYEEFLLESYQKLQSEKDGTSRAIPVDHPEWAAVQDYYMTLDPELKRVPRERLLKTYEQLEKFSNIKRSNQLSWEEQKADMGGRTRCLMFDPNDPKSEKAWAGSVTGGLWFNNDITDPASPWQAVNDFWDHLSISSVTYDPQNTRTFYAGTGESHTARVIYRESSGRGYGIWKSTDSGKSWTVLASTKHFAYINDLEIRTENDTSVIYAAVVSGIYEGKKHQSQPTDGLYRSKDGGNNWEQVLPDIPGDTLPYAVSDIEVTAKGRILVGTMKNLNQKGGANILYSDAGTKGSWKVYNNYENIIKTNSTNNIPGRVMLSATPNAADTIYAIIGSGYISPVGFNFSTGNYILKSYDHGENWKAVSIPPLNQGRNWATLAWHAFAVRVHPTEPDVVFIGGLDVYRTSNGGDNWQRLSDWSRMYDTMARDDYVHADIHDFEFRPGKPDEMIISTDGGVFYTQQARWGSPVFRERNKSYNTLQFYSADIFPVQNSNIFMGGLQDNGTIYYPNRTVNIFDMLSGGDGAYCFFDKNEPNLFLTSIYYNRYYTFYNNNLFSFIGNFQSGIFINPADYDSRSNVLYANACMFDGQYADQLLIIQGIPFSNSGSFKNLGTGSTLPFSHVRYSGLDTRDNVFLGTQSGKLFKVENILLKNFTVHDIGTKDFPTANISCIALGSTEDSILVTFSNYGVPSVWVTADGGNNWKSIEGNLPDIPVRWALIHPGNSSDALIATETGVWRCTNIWGTAPRWELVNNGLANVRVDMLSLRENDMTVLAATHGRGLFTTKWSKADEVLQANFYASSQWVVPGDSVQFFDVSTGKTLSRKWFFEGGKPAGSNLKNPYITYENEGTYDVKLLVSDSSSSDSLIMENYIEVKAVSLDDNVNKGHLVIINRGPGQLLLKFQNPAKEKRIVEVFSLSGKRIYSGKTEQGHHHIDLSDYPHAVVIVKLSGINGAQVKRALL